MKSFFVPAGCAVVGASRDPAKPGHQMLQSLLEAGYPSGRLFPINPKESRIAGLPAYPDLMSVPAAVELAVIMVPPPAMDAVLADSVARARARGDLRALIVTAGGYAELGSAEGRERQARLVEGTRKAGIRLIGPNCVGIIDTFSHLDTTFLHGVAHRQGPISFVSQSGAVGAWLLQMLSSEPRPVGFSKFISLGNMADVSMAETLDYLGQDPNTGVVGLYLEGVPEPRPLLRAMAGLAQTKPVVVLKTGRTESGRAAAASHTGALAGADRIWEGALRQAGVLRTDGMEEFVDTLRVLAAPARPSPGRSPEDGAVGDAPAALAQIRIMAPLRTPLRVFLMTHAGGPGVYTMDLLAARSKDLAPAIVRPETKTALLSAVPPLSSVCRPEGHLDMTASATPEQHAQVVGLLLRDPGVDALLTIDLPIRFLGQEEVARALVEAWMGDQTAGKLFLPLLMHGRWSEAGRVMLETAGLPALAGPDRAVAVLANVARLAELRAGWAREDFALPPAGAQGLPGRDRPTATGGSEAEPGGVTLNEVESARLLSGTGVVFPPGRLVASKDEAVSAARDLGFPVVVKLCSRLIPHKAALGAVRLDLRAPDDVTRACDELVLVAAGLSAGAGSPGAGLLPAGFDGFLVQAQAPRGLEVIVGGLRDPIFGPVVAAGSGGGRVGRDAPLVFRLAPLSDTGARRLAVEAVAEAVAGSGTSAVAGGGGRDGEDGIGGPVAEAAEDAGYDLDALGRVILGLSRLVATRPDVVEADLNPVILLPGRPGAIAVDALVRLA